jgi:hypothetical protein
VTTSLLPALPRSQKQQYHILQVQVPREVEFASFWLMEVPWDITVIEKIITGKSLSFISPYLPD